MTWYLICALFVLGLWGVVALPNLIRKIVGLSFMNTAVILLFVYQGSLPGRRAPILGSGEVVRAGSNLADPLPQALMLTAIVVGICIVAVALVISYQLYRRHKTLDIGELERIIWNRDAHESD